MTANRKLEARSFRGVALALALVAAGCGGGHLVAVQPSTVLLSQPQDPQLVRAAVVRAMAARGFQAEADQPGVLVAHSMRRGQDLRLQIAYSPTQFQITYLASDGFGFVPGPNGGLIQPRFQRVVSDLGRSINDEMERPAREAAAQGAAALEAQRRHDEEMARLSRPVIVRQGPPSTVYVQGGGGTYVQGSGGVAVGVNGVGVAVQGNGVGVRANGVGVNVQGAGVGVGVSAPGVDVSVQGGSVGVAVPGASVQVNH